MTVEWKRKNGNGKEEGGKTGNEGQREVIISLHVSDNADGKSKSGQTAMSGQII